MRFFYLFLTIITLFKSSAHKITTLEKGTELTGMKFKSKSHIPSRFEKYKETFTVNYNQIHTNLMKFYDSKFDFINFDQELIRYFEKAKMNYHLHLEIETLQRFDYHLELKTMSLKKIIQTFMFLGVFFQNNFLFDTAIYINRFETKAVKGNYLKDYFKKDKFENLRKCMIYLNEELLQGVELHKKYLNITKLEINDLESVNQIFNQYLKAFFEQNKKTVFYNGTDYLKKFRVKDFTPKICYNRFTNLKLHYILFESIFTSPKSRNTLLLFPEMLYFRMSIAKMEVFTRFQIIHFFVTFIIFKVESILMFLFQKEVDLKRVKFLPRYVLKILESIELTGRALILLYIDAIKDFNLFIYNDYFMFLTQYSFCKVYGINFNFLNNHKKSFYTLEEYHNELKPKVK
ncbi:hypothetical protein TUBRATIS_009250 [Tubulinosema ratisbonensis]|uniref:Uncharacterized protein n=1 Tax=Tubulinosema ratisbonensis TaxID=291195 RepID=A0A437AN90_9MICR|nr:hypothetical protein TUBRATIS_009250 [Tubulinosema ratisbonensis]